MWSRLSATGWGKKTSVPQPDAPQDDGPLPGTPLPGAPLSRETAPAPFEASHLDFLPPEVPSSLQASPSPACISRELPQIDPALCTSAELTALRQELAELRRERDYYRRQVETLAGESIRLDSTISTLRHALTQKQQGFAILAEMYQTMGGHPNLTSTFARIVGAVNATLGMDKSVMLLPAGSPGRYEPSTWLGFESSFDEHLSDLALEIPHEWIQRNTPLLVNKTTSSTPLIETIRASFDLPYFIALPILDGTNPIALLVTGRMTERRPFAAALDSGDVDTLQSIGLLVSSIAYNQRMTALQEDNQVLRHLATIDKLTGIANRRRFEEVLTQEWQRCARRESPIAVFLVDVDHFKRINDSHGHDIGDIILRQVADRLTAGLRPGDMGARYGGEEFAVVLPDTDGDGALAVAERIRSDIESIPMHHGGRYLPAEVDAKADGDGNAFASFSSLSSSASTSSGSISTGASPYSIVTVSIGVAHIIPEAHGEPGDLLKRADVALYRAKREGRNRVRSGA